MKKTLNLLASAALLLSSAAYSQVTVGIPAYPLGSTCVGAFSQRALVSAPRISAKAGIDKANRQVRLDYSLRAPTSNETIDRAAVTVNVRFWPTAVHLGSMTELYVAGRATNGATVISKYTLTLPLMGTSQNPTTGEVVEFVTAGQVGSMTSLLSESVVGRDGIQALGSVEGGSEPILLMQYADSKDLWTLGVTSQLHQLVAGPALSPPGLGGPELDRFNNLLTGFSDDIFGNVYLLDNCHLDAFTDESIFCILYDSDLDGTLDGFLSGNDSVWMSLGLDDLVKL
jgi:hypothetical protein